MHYLDWNKIGWERFQDITVHIAQNKFPDCDFQLYLKKGQKQDGIDIKSFNRRDSSLICIQCKDYRKIKVSDLENVVREFQREFYNNFTSCFILATTADLQKPELQKKILDLKIELEKSGIQFECWDKDDLDTILKSYWNIVAYYFSEYDAHAHCLQQINFGGLDKIKPMADYLPRLVTPYIITKVQSPPSQLFADFSKPLDLNEIFLEQSAQVRRICVLGEAYQGKSFYLKQLAYNLKEGGKHYYPLLLEIKGHTIQPIEKILELQYRAWKQIAISDLVIFIDGLDEAPSDKFNEIAEHVNEFSLTYPSLSIVFSCRKVFYNDYKLSNIIKDFDVFQLHSLQYSDIISHVSTVLPSQKEEFFELARKREIVSLLYYPFFLIKCVTDFKDNPESLPTSKIAALEAVIKDSNSASQERRVGNGDLLRHQTVLFQKAIEKLAFAFQLMGVNALDNNDIQMLLSEKEIKLLRHNSLISISGNNWSFINAMFQEHLAALMLSKLPYLQIEHLITIGNHKKKIKLKWLQTFSSLLALTNNTEQFQKLLTLLKKDNIELIFQTEKTKYHAKFKAQVLKELIEKCISLHIRPTIVYEDTIGGFVGDIPEANEYLLFCLNSPAIPEFIKITCSRIIYYCDLSLLQQSSLYKLVKTELFKTSDGYYASCLFRLLSKYKFGTKTDIENWIQLPQLKQQHRFRQGIYELITVLGLAEHFYNYALEGFPILIKHNVGVSHAFSEDTLENLLLATNKREDIQKLFRLMQSNEWIEFYRYDSTTEKFLRRLNLKLIEIFSKNPLIVLDVVAYEKSLVEKHLKDDLKEMQLFFAKTSSDWIAVRLLLQNFKDNFGWEYGSLISEKSFDYILFEYEQSDLEMRPLHYCIVGLRHNGTPKVADDFLQLCIDATQGKIEQRDSEANIYQQNQLKKHENDIQYIQSAEAFKEGVEKYFTAYGKKAIPEEDIWVDRDANTFRNAADSNFVLHFLIEAMRNKNVVYLKDCIKKIDDNHWFTFFRAEEISRYEFTDKAEDKQILKQILKNYYYEGLKTAKFENRISDIQPYRYLKESQLTQIFQKFEFETTSHKLIEMVWMDNGGIRNFENSNSNNTKSLSQLIIEKLKPTDLPIFKQKIVENIRSGIKAMGVLENHIEICKHLQIFQARELLLEIILKRGITEWWLHDVMDIYLKLNGNLMNLLPFFEGIDNCTYPYYFFLVDKLKGAFPEEVKISLLKFFYYPQTSEELKVAIAKQLCHMGITQGFIFLVDKVRATQKSPFSIQGNYKIDNIDTSFALDQLKDIMYLVIDPAFERKESFHDSARNIIIEWLYGFASKSENDLLLVEDFFKKCGDALGDLYSNISDFNWYISRIIENFRNTAFTSFDLHETKKMIEELEK